MTIGETGNGVKRVRFKGVIDTEFDSEKQARDAKTAISHEGNVGRAEANIMVKGKKLSVNIEAGDAVAFRALLNSILRDFQIIQEAGKDL